MIRRHTGFKCDWSSDVCSSDLNRPLHSNRVEIKKAIITAAGKNQRGLPLQTLVDRDGATKTALHIIIEEILAAGIDEICVIVCPGDQAAYAAAAGRHGGRLQLIEQTSPRRYCHPVFCARDFVGSKPFLLLVGDHLYVSG